MGSQSSRVNKKIGVPIIGKLESSLSKHSSDRGLVLGCFILFPDNTITHEYASLFHVLLVTPKAVEMFCLLSGEKRYPVYTPPEDTTIVSSVLSRDYINSTHIIVAESNGVFSIIEAYTLILDKRIGLSHSLPSLNTTKNVILAMISPAPEMLYVGYLSGVVKVWHTAVTAPQFIFGKEYELPSVRCLMYASKHRKLIVGYDGSFENQHGKSVKVEKNLLRVFIPNASEENSEVINLEGFSGTCFSIAIIEMLDLVVAISSEDCGMFIWNLNSYELVIKINIPRFESNPQIVTQVYAIEDHKNCYLVFGESDGSLIVSQIKYEGDNLMWMPLKKINPQIGGNYAIEYLMYVDRIDTLVVGNTWATALLISNFLDDVLEFGEVAKESASS